MNPERMLWGLSWTKGNWLTISYPAPYKTWWNLITDVTDINTFFLGIFNFLKQKEFWNPLEVQWLGLCAFTAKGMGSIPGWETKIPQATQHDQRQIKIEEVLPNI